MWQGGLGNWALQKRVIALVSEFLGGGVLATDSSRRYLTLWDSCWRIVLISTSHVAPVLAICCPSMSKEYLVSAALF